MGHKVLAYDHNISPNSPRGMAKLQKAQGDGIILSDNLGLVVRGSRYIISTVTPAGSREIALNAAQHMAPGQVFFDLNSSAPVVKEQMGEEFAARGLDFVDGAIMGSPVSTGLKTTILASGRCGKEKLGALPDVFNISWMGDRVGRASAVKMCTSIVTKGLQAILWEEALLARFWQVEDEVCANLTRLFDNRSFSWWREYSLGSSAIHAGRRAEEMNMAIQTLCAAGIPVHLSTGIRDTMAWLAGMGLREHYQGEQPEDLDQLVGMVFAGLGP